MGTNRAVFNCPAAMPESRSDTNIDKTLGKRKGLDGAIDPLAISETSLFPLATMIGASTTRANSRTSALAAIWTGR
jgi:hypothetical protein